MKKILLATSAIVAAVVAAPAGAADLRAPIMKAPPVVRPACAQFGGWYVGAHAGWGYYDYKWNDRDAWSSELSDDLQRSNVSADKGGFLGGVQGGYNWQSGCTVFGIEADYAWSSINASSLETDADIGVDTDSLLIESRLKGIGTVRARTGVVVDNLLIYVTGGFAYAKFDRSFSQVDLNPPGAAETFNHSRTRWGWTAGFGTEWAINQNWSLKSEVLYARFEKDEQNFTCVVFCGGLPGEPKRFESQDSIWTTKIGLNYRFGGGYPAY